MQYDSGTHAADTELIAGRYRIIKLLKCDRTGEHFLAYDLPSEKDVIVRVLKASSISASTRLRLEYEAKSLRELDLPYLAGISSIDQDGNNLLVVRSFLPGITLQERLAKSPLDYRETVAVGRGLFAALKAAHERGIFHHNIRPTNIIIEDRIPIESAVLSDFGLGLHANGDELSVKEAVETALYLSPESAGALDYDVGETSDLYSAGIVLFECLTGHTPFRGEKAGAILYQHMTGVVPELRSVGVDLPLALDELIQRLLRKDPRDRYQTAEAVLMDLESIAEETQDVPLGSNFVVGSHDRRPTLTEPALVGRDKEIEQIEEQIQIVHGGRSRLVFLEGESGGGKTRFLGEIALRGAKAAMWVLRGQGTDLVGKKPFQVLHGVVEQITVAARNDQALSESLRDRLGEHLDVLGASFPELANVLGGKASAALGPEAFVEYRTIQSLAALIAAVGTQERPAMILLDECQWADELTCKLIRWRETQPSAGPCHVMLVAAFRSEEVLDGHILRTVKPSLAIRLKAFTPQEIRKQIESMAGTLPDDAVNLVVQFAEGNPFMASAVLRGLVESGALVADPKGWRIEPLTMADLGSSNRAASFLARRLELLPAETIQLLSIAAILGKEFDLEMVALLSGQQPSQAIAAIEEARQRHLVWSRPDGGSFAFVHDKVRAALLDRMTVGQRAAWHREAATHLQRHDPEKFSEIAFHFDAAGEYQAALPYALKAAEQARRQFALEVAEQQYRIAERGVSSADAPAKYHITEGLGEVLMLRGKYAQAGELFESAAALVNDDFSRAQVLGKIGELAHKRGDMQAASEAIEKSLRLLGVSIPKSVFFWMPMLFVHVIWQAIHTLLPTWLRGVSKKRPCEKILLQLRLLSRLSYSYWYSKWRPIVFLVHLMGMNKAECYLPTAELASFYSEHAVAMTLTGFYRRGLEYARRSYRIRESLGDAWGQGQSLSFWGVVLYASSRYLECIEKCREAVRLLERTGDWWEVHIARYQIAASYYRLGKLQEAVSEARQIHLSGIELGDEQASGINLDTWALASGGKVPHNILKVEVERTRSDFQAMAQVFLAQGVQLTENGRNEEAAGVLKQALDECDRVGIMNVYVAPLIPWLATALRREAESPKIRSFEKRANLLASAEAAASRAIRTARIMRNDLPHALREYAIILAMSDKHGAVLKLLRESLAEAEKQGARYEYAKTLMTIGQLGVELNWPNAAEQIAEAQMLLIQLRVPLQTGEGENAPASKLSNLSMADRFEVVLGAGRKIASALTGAEIFEEVCSASLRLLRAEYCQVLQILGDAKNFRLIPVAGKMDEKFDEVLIRQAIQAEKAVAFDGSSLHQGNAGCDLDDNRSILCVPLYVRGRAVACLYVVHQHIHKLFGRDEERLAGFIAAIAGAALENSEGFKLLQQLNATLEKRIVERTMAAEARALELAQSNQELERVASELLQTQEQLHIAMQAAKSANLAKSRFLATMSHEIRTPMNGIIGMAELALGTTLTGQQRNYLTTLKDSANLLLDILNDILDFSKIEAGKMELEAIPCNIHKIVEDVARLLAVTASKKNLELICRIAPDVPPRIVGDSKRLRQIVVNLVGNAIKFTESGEVFIRVGVADKAESKVHLHFTVQDTGIGIPSDKKVHIFEAFRQSDSSVTRRFGGTGLGLAICSQLMELMGGSIWVESEPGAGSEFHFSAWFDLAEGENSIALPHFENGIALVAGENHNVRDNCREILENAGLKVRIAEDRQSTVAAMGEIKVGLSKDAPAPILVVDAGRREASGFAWLECMPKGELDGWRIVVLTPAVLVDGIERCQKLGIRQCIPKPVKDTELLEAIHSERNLSEADIVPAPASQVETNHVSLRVLVADDSPINQEVMAGLLEMHGHQVHVADNGVEAIEAFTSHDFDIILMDVEMPEMDGLTASMRIREIEKNQHRRVPILAMTAHVMDSVRIQCMESGMDGYVSKPIQPEELFDALKTFCPQTDFQPTPS